MSMEYRIAGTFSDSLGKLTSQEQKAVKTTAFDLQMNPSHPSLQFHRIDRTKDPNFWSIRVNRDIRIIVHKTNHQLLLCYVDHHDDAYKWAERRKLETHPKTGAAQLVEIRELVKEIVIPYYVQEDQPLAPKPPLFAEVEEETLLSYGVPPEWLEDVQKADEDSLFGLVDHLPEEASEALLELASGKKPAPPTLVAAGTDPFEHPDAQRRFRVMDNLEALERALEYPWEKWTVFLHPAQQELVEKDYSGPARVSGSAGTGKTIVALHRAVYLAEKDPDDRTLILTFSETLADAIRLKLQRLLGKKPRMGERIEVYDFNTLGKRLFKLNIGKYNLIAPKEMRELIVLTAKELGETQFSEQFLMNEWNQVVDAWQLKTWDAYQNVQRLGRRTRLPQSKREKLWAIYEKVWAKLGAQVKLTLPGLFEQLAIHVQGMARPPFHYAIIDEAQDVSVPQLRFLAAMGGNRPNALFFAGDLGQRIFQQPFSWKALGVEVQGRSRSLRINYRTSHQIRMKADLLLGTEIADVDGNREERKGTVSVFNGPQPEIVFFEDEAEEILMVSEWLKDRINEGYAESELAVFVRSKDQITRAKQSLILSKLPYHLLGNHVDAGPGQVSVCTMHRAKGLEFRGVVVMACDDEVIPLQSRIESVTDESDLEEVYHTERHLLYVACTRARDRLLVCGVDPGSEFLEDME